MDRSVALAQGLQELSDGFTDDSFHRVSLAGAVSRKHG
jgi:hypothetical protein